MSNVTLNKNALTVPTVVFNNGVLSSNKGGNLTWNDIEVGSGSLNAEDDIIFEGQDTFNQYVTFNGGFISNGDIVLNGSKLLLANGASVELYTGEGIPLPEGGSGPISPGTGNSGGSIDTSNFATLNGNNNFTGTLTINGNSIVTKNVADETYLKVNGSNKIAGHIHVDDSSLKTFTIGYPWADKIGALLSLRGINYESSGEEGTFALGAINSENVKFLEGYPDGKLTWAGKNITRIENSSRGTNNWYIKLDNGLIIQGGTVNAYDKTLTFPTAFSDTNYAFSIFLMATEYINNDFTVAAGKTTSGITSIRMGSGNGSYGYNAGWTHSWIAIGY